MKVYCSLLFLVCLISFTSSSVQADSSKSDSDYFCVGGDGYYNCELCPCRLRPQIGGMMIIINVVSLICIANLILGFLFIKELRVQPGDFFFGYALGQGILTILSLIEIIYSLLNDKIEATDPICKRFGFLRVFAYRVVGLYHLCFMVYYLTTLRNSLRLSKIPKFLFHSIPWVLAFLRTLHIALYTGLGKNIQGDCDIKSSPYLGHYWMELTLCVQAFLLSALLIQRFSSYADTLDHYTRKYINYYGSYFVLASIVLISGYAIKAYGVHTLKKFLNSFKTEPRLEYYDQIFVVGKFSSLLDTISIIVMTFIQLRDPIHREHWKDFYYRIFCCCRPRRLPEGEDPMNTSSSGRTISLTASQLMKSIKKQSFLIQVQHNYRVQVVYSLLASIHYYWQADSNNEGVMYTSKNTEDYNRKAKKTINYQITDTLIEDTLPEIIQDVRSKSYSIVDGKLTVYAPEIFKELIQAEMEDEQLSKSLDLGKNYHRILKSGVADGGRGGEFFFFSGDNQLVIKTVSNEELKVLLKLLARYSQHFSTYPDSLIAKIYGVFTFEVKNPYEKYHLILMKNINGFPSLCTDRKYDLKGSTIARQVVMVDNVKKSSLKHYGTMKDLDFNKFEQCLHISDDIRNKLYETLARDVAFLTSEGLIDYSLVVYVVNKKELAKYTDSGIPSDASQESSLVDTSELQTTSPVNKDKRIPPKEMAPINASLEPANPLISTKSTVEDVFYHIGIIDYLVTYSCNKRIEKLFKQLKAFNSKLDVSSQPPPIYSRRFLAYMEKIIIKK